ncbi:serine hydrolase domain-containing protein [Nonomuraea sp. NPDC049714]|uniref:serine hydrolase domain-containing protein n=1 Tax=Nonomuraea sp. NPDC049714 TaxID=3364357 RepID=UPI00378D588D
MSTFDEFVPAEGFGHADWAAGPFFATGVGPEWFEHRNDTYTPRQLVKIALAHPPTGEPGQRFKYSNTNYILAAMIVEMATGKTFEQELIRNVIRPLRLTGTSLPGTASKIRGPHPVHYSILFSRDPQPTIYDATQMNQSFAWSAGGIISTATDLNRFFAALFGGRVLPRRLGPAQRLHRRARRRILPGRFLTSRTARTSGLRFTSLIAAGRTSCGFVRVVIRMPLPSSWIRARRSASSASVRSGLISIQARHSGRPASTSATRDLPRRSALSLSVGINASER